MSLVCRLLLALLMLPSVAAAEAPFIRPGDRVLFLGDSNTHAGQYIVYLEAWLTKYHPKENYELVNLGLPSETASGLSEPAHPFPRPTVHERLDRALEKGKPQVVVACYGMNDGIYYPPSAEHLKAYQQGMQVIADKARKIGARTCFITPPPFEADALRPAGKLRPAGAKEYAWFAPYENYDDVLAEFSTAVIAMKADVDAVVDVRTPLLKVMRQKRKENPGYHLAGDGIHFNADGHEVIARTLWKAWHLEPADPGPLPSAELMKLHTQRQSLLHNAWLTDVGHKRPDMAKGEPLESAQSQAREIYQRIKEK